MTCALAIDTTSDSLALALMEAGGSVTAHREALGTGITAHILPAIQRLLGDAGLAPAALQLLIVARGPGSFTGTRIGLAVAKSFAQVLALPLIGVDTLRLLAAAAEPEEARTFYALLNCARDEVYHAPFCRRGGTIQAEGPIGMATFAELPALLGGAPAVLRRLGPGERDEIPVGLNLLPFREPEPEGLLREGLALRKCGGPLPPADPIYLKSEAFRKWKP